MEQNFLLFGSYNMLRSLLLFLIPLGNSYFEELWIAHLRLGPSVSLEWLPIRAMINESKVLSIELMLYICPFCWTSVFTQTSLWQMVRGTQHSGRKPLLWMVWLVRWNKYCFIHLRKSGNQMKWGEDSRLGEFSFIAILSFRVDIVLFRNFSL